ncbi:hypothetical protein [Phenylobacterium sp.]|uniref:hypothetical protein n=1 Tax=Phenylobacterium sp. TaxID=1871053 RepID=UPI0025FFD343|nr:hypothetical protein [Phenylobacterium sp.]
MGMTVRSRMWAPMTGLLAGCAPNAAEQRGLRPGDTQVVAQWVMTSDRTGPYFAAESQIAKASEGLYFEDGNDVGGGYFNVYLYTDHVPETVAHLIDMERAGKVPRNLRIGVAVYKGGDRSDWTYRPAHPATLTLFGVF